MDTDFIWFGQKLWWKPTNTLYELGLRKTGELYNFRFTDNFSRRALLPVFIMVGEKNNNNK
jgi:hypothetical protein